MKREVLEDAKPLDVVAATFTVEVSLAAPLSVSAGGPAGEAWARNLKKTEINPGKQEIIQKSSLFEGSLPPGKTKRNEILIRKNLLMGYGASGFWD